MAAGAFFAWTRIQQSTPFRHERHRYEPRRRGEREPHSSRRERGYENREEAPAACQAFSTACRSTYFRSWNQPHDGTCRTRREHGYPVPDPRCTPGGINPTISLDIIKDPRWRTGCIRNCQTSEEQKHVTYAWYGIRRPHKNSGEHQVCELDHLVPLELGGADGLGNIWPQCGPDRVTLNERYFKQKDHVENYLEDEVKGGRMPLAEAQRGIASDWVQYLPAATRYCEQGGRC